MKGVKVTHLHPQLKIELHKFLEICDTTQQCADNTDEKDCLGENCQPNTKPCKCNQYGNNTCIGSPCYSEEGKISSF